MQRREHPAAAGHLLPFVDDAQDSQHCCRWGAELLGSCQDSCAAPRSQPSTAEEVIRNLLHGPSG